MFSYNSNYFCYLLTISVQIGTVLVSEGVNESPSQSQEPLILSAISPEIKQGNEQTYKVPSPLSTLPEVSYRCKCYGGACMTSAFQ